MRSSWTTWVPPRPAAGRGACSGSRSVAGPWLGAAGRSGSRRPGCGSAASGPPTARGTTSPRRGRPGPVIASLDVVPRRAWRRTPPPSTAPAGRRGGRRRRAGCGTGRCPPTKAMSRLGSSAVAEHDELLVVRAAGAHPHVQQRLARRGLDRPSPRWRFSASRSRSRSQVRAPDQAAHVDPALGRRGRAPRRPRCPARRSSRSSGSPRQSAKKTRSPARSRLRCARQLGEVGRRRGRAGAPGCPRSTPRRPGCRASSRVRGLPRSAASRNQSAGGTTGCLPARRPRGQVPAGRGERDWTRAVRAGPRPPAAGPRRGRAGRGAARGAGRPRPAPGGGCRVPRGGHRAGAPGPSRSGAAGARVRRVACPSWSCCAAVLRARGKDVTLVRVPDNGLGDLRDQARRGGRGRDRGAHPHRRRLGRRGRLLRRRCGRPLLGAAARRARAGPSACSRVGSPQHGTAVAELGRSVRRPRAPSPAVSSRRTATCSGELNARTRPRAGPRSSPSGPRRTRSSSRPTRPGSTGR